MTRILILLLLLGSATAQLGTVQWNKTIGGPGDDEFYKITPLADGGYILSSNSNSAIGDEKVGPVYGKDDGWLIKIDAHGNTVWQKTLGTSENEWYPKVLEAANGNLYVFMSSTGTNDGNRTVIGRGSFDVWFVKLGKSGNILQQGVYGGTNYDQVIDAIFTSDGNILLAISSNSPAGFEKSKDPVGYDPGKPLEASDDIWMLKIDTAGNKIWDAIIGSNGVDYSSATVELSDGYLVAGYVAPDSTKSWYQYDYFLVKLNISGDTVWTKKIEGIGRDYAYSVIIDGDGNLIIAGESESGQGADKSQASFGQSDWWIVKLDGSGNKIWDKTFGGKGEDIPTDIKLLPNNQYQVLGVYSREGLGGDTLWDARILTLDANGTIVDDTIFGGDSTIYLVSCVPASDGGYLLGGSSSSAPFTNKDGTKRGGLDVWLMKTTGITATAVPAETKYFSVRTNPFQHHFSLEAVQPATYRIVDAMGRIVHEGVAKQGKNTVTMEGLANGSYTLIVGKEHFRLVKY